MVHRRFYFRIELFIENGSRDANSERFHVPLESLGIVWDRRVYRRYIFGIIAGDRLEQKSGILHAAAHRPDMVQRPRQRDHAPGTNAPIRRLQTGYATV